MSFDASTLPDVRGQLIMDAPLAPYTWFRVGGPTDVLFLPADADDLSAFLAALPEAVPVTVLGVGSNVIVRDGGLAGVVVRLAGRAWAQQETVSDETIRVGTGALDLAVAKTAAEAGQGGLSFLSGIPGTLGGAMRTNAGCYGRELKDVLVSIEAVTRAGDRVQLPASALGLTYRHSDLPEDLIVTSATLKVEPGQDPAALKAEIDALQVRRAESQPIKEKTGGSTFANPDPPGTENQRSAWKLIDAAGCRGLKVGGAQVSEKHCNFLINTGEATAADLEALGELVRARVRETSGVVLRWEVRRIGRYG